MRKFFKIKSYRKFLNVLIVKSSTINLNNLAINWKYILIDYIKKFVDSILLGLSIVTYYYYFI